MISTARRRSSIGASGSSIITAVKPIAKVMFNPCDRMVVDHLSIEVETGHNDYSIMLNRSQQLRNDTSSQQLATGAQRCATELNRTQVYVGSKTDTQQISRRRNRYATGQLERRYVLTPYDLIMERN